MALLLLAALVTIQAETLESLVARAGEEKALPADKRQATLAAIGALQNEAAAAVLATLYESEKQAAVKTQLVAALGACGTPPALRKLATVSIDRGEAPLHRAAALRFIMEGATTEGFDAAGVLLRGREGGDLRTAAYFLLHHYTLARTEPLWRAALNDPDPLLRGRALLMLAPLKDLRLLDLAKQALANPGEEPFVKYGSVAVLQAAGGAATAKLLLAAAVGADSTLKRLLGEALGSFTEEKAAEAVFAGLRHADPGVRIVSARALATLQHPKAMDRLGEPLKDKDPEVHSAALESVARRRDKTSEAILQKEAQRSDEEAAAVAIAQLPQFPSDATHALLLKLAAHHKPGIAIPALDALGGLKLTDALPVFQKALGNRDWPIRVAAIRGLSKLKLVESIDALVERMQKEEGRMLAECRDALDALTGKGLGYAAGHWKDWWAAARENFSFPDAKAAGAAAGPGNTTTYHGITVLSTRLVFCLDISGSMAEIVTGKESRLDQAKKELVRVLGQLNKEASFNMIFFDDKVEPWQQGMVGIKSTLKASQDKVNALQPRGTTNIFDTLVVAFQHKEVDTVFLLSDGEPTAGRVVDTEDVLREVRKLNRIRQIVIHTISFGPSPFMKRLAAQNGGQYVEVK